MESVSKSPEKPSVNRVAEATPPKLDVVKKKLPSLNKPYPKKKLPRLGVSIKGGSKKAENQLDEHPVEGVAPHLEQVVDQNELEIQWRTFARAQENFAEQTLLTVIPRLYNKTEIKVELDNAFQETTVNEMKQNLLPFLRKELRNSDLTLTTQVSAALESTRAFTPRERLKELIVENPDIDLLIKRFSLEVE